MNKEKNKNRVLYIDDAMEYSREDMDELLEEVMFIEGMSFQCKTPNCQPATND